jgi:transposase
MREITMSIEEQRRTMVVTRVVAGSLSMTEATTLLGLSERSVWRLKRCFLADGPAGLVHGNRGRPPARRLDDAVRARIVDLAGGRFEGANDCHLVDLLAEEGLVVSRATVQRVLRAAGRPSPRHRRPPRHRSRRDRMPQAGLLVQLDGSRHDWLESRGPRLTLVDAVDDATGILTGTTSASRRTSPATLEILRDTVGGRRSLPSTCTPRGSRAVPLSRLLRRRLADSGMRSIGVRCSWLDPKEPTPQFGGVFTRTPVTSDAGTAPEKRSVMPQLPPMESPPTSYEAWIVIPLASGSIVSP